MLPKKTFGMAATIRRLRKNRYDAVVNLHLNNSASASLVSRLARGGVVIESSRENAFAAETGNHVVTMTARLLKPLSVAPITQENERDHPLELKLPHDSILRAQQILKRLLEELMEKESRRVLINISTTHPSRNWPTEHFTATAHLLREAGFIPIICGTPADAERAREIATQGGAQLLPPQNNYADFAAAVAQVDGVITPDTSTVHLAAALGRPTVALYASAQAAQAWPPWSVPHSTLLATEGMEKISPETVAAAMRELMQGERQKAQGANSGMDRQPQH
jgi:ADP-heptose:LPS heptosyltransferase